MKVKIIRSTVVKGVGNVTAGQELDVEPFDAKVLMAMGKAVPVATAAKKPATRKTKTTTKESADK